MRAVDAAHSMEGTVTLQELFSALVYDVHSHSSGLNRTNFPAARTFVIFDAHSNPGSSELKPVAKILFYTDKVKVCATIQELFEKTGFEGAEPHPGVEGAEPLRVKDCGIARQIVKVLKRVAVATKRTAHVQLVPSVTSECLRALLVSEGFTGGTIHSGFFSANTDMKLPPSHPQLLTTTNWFMKVVWVESFKQHGFLNLKNAEIPAQRLAHVEQLVNIWKVSIPGMQAFADQATWFSPDVDLANISKSLNIPIKDLEWYSVPKACYSSSAKFAALHSNKFFTVHGIAVDPELDYFATEHACLGTFIFGRLYTFDLVRKSPLFMFGVFVSPALQNSVSKMNSHAGDSVINGLNYIKQRSEDGEEIGKTVCRILKTFEKKRGNF